jgi:hypothetical protein
MYTNSDCLFESFVDSWSYYVLIYPHKYPQIYHKVCVHYKTTHEVTRREVIDVQCNQLCGKTQRYFSVPEIATHYYQWDLKRRRKSVEYISSRFLQF